MDPLKIDSKHYKLEFENDQVRVFRVHIGPHESTPMHEHQLICIDGLTRPMLPCASPTPMARWN